MHEIIISRIKRCSEKVNEYDRWLKLLRYPNMIFVIGGSLLAFIGGAAVLTTDFGDTPGYMALIGGVLTGFHGWFGCEAHQQKCKEIRTRYNSLKLKFERLLSERDNKEAFIVLDDLFIELESNIDAKPWI